MVPLALLEQLRALRTAERERHAPEDARLSRHEGTRTAAHGTRSPQREVEDREDAFLLDAGMGPMAYLTSDGRVLLDHRGWDGEGTREATLDEAIASLVVGAHKTRIAELLDLIPPCPDNACTCSRCEGARWDKPLGEQGLKIICVLCAGRGWATEPMIDAARLHKKI